MSYHKPVKMLINDKKSNSEKLAYSRTELDEKNINSNTSSDNRVGDNNLTLNPTTKQTENHHVEYISQISQKCAICGQYVLASDNISNLNNKSSPYHGWMCHNECLPITK